MDLVNLLLGGLGLAAAAGLNAWIPLLVLGAAARWLPAGTVELASQYQFLTSDWFLILVAVLGFIEFFADKIAVVDHVNDVVQTIVRPVAGAVLFASTSGVVDGLHPTLALVLGFLAAGSVHGIKSAARPVVTAATGGVGNPIVSFIEDALSLALTLAAILLPLLLLAFFVGIPWLLFRWLAKRRRQRAMAQFDAVPRG
jgi:hypothetical protein